MKKININAAILLLGLVVLGGCTKTITVFSVKRQVEAKPALLIIKPQIANLNYNEEMEKALISSVVKELEVEVKSYSVGWKSSTPLYNNFFHHLYQSSKKVFHQKSNSLIEASSNEKYKDSFLKNLTLFGDNYSKFLKKSGAKSWNPKFLLVTGFEKYDQTFTGNLKIKVYSVLVEIKTKEVFWGMSFEIKAVNNPSGVAMAAIKAGKKLAGELNTWFKNNIAK